MHNSSKGQIYKGPITCTTHFTFGKSSKSNQCRCNVGLNKQLRELQVCINETKKSQERSDISFAKGGWSSKTKTPKFHVLNSRFMKVIQAGSHPKEFAI